MYSFHLVGNHRRKCFGGRKRKRNKNSFKLCVNDFLSFRPSTNSKRSRKETNSWRTARKSSKTPGSTRGSVPRKSKSWLIVAFFGNFSWERFLCAGNSNTSSSLCELDSLCQQSVCFNPELDEALLNHIIISRIYSMRWEMPPIDVVRWCSSKRKCIKFRVQVMFWSFSAKERKLSETWRSFAAMNRKVANDEPVVVILSQRIPKILGWELLLWSRWSSLILFLFSIFSRRHFDPAHPFKIQSKGTLACQWSRS